MLLITLAWRNLRRNLRRTLISAAAIGFGLGFMVFAISFATGSYNSMIRSGVSSLAGHVVVQHPDWVDDHELVQLVEDSGAVGSQLAALFPDATVARRIQFEGLLTSAQGSVGVGMMGVEPGPEAQVNRLAEQVQEGAWLGEDDRGILIGVGLARSLRVEVGDKVVWMGQVGERDMDSRLFRVAGIFRTGADQLDGFFALTTLGAAQDIVDMGDVATMVTLHLPDGGSGHDQAVATRAAMPDSPNAIYEWKEALPEVHQMIQVDKTSNNFILGIIGLIVAMGMLNTVLMSVMERTREFGVMMAVGLKPRQLATVILLEGALLGVLGTVGGLAFGALLSWPAMVWGIDMTSMGESASTAGVTMDMHVFAAPDYGRTAAFAVAAVFFTMGAALWPAWRAARMEPVHAMRQQ